MATSSPNPSTADLVDGTLAVAAGAPIVTLALFPLAIPSATMGPLLFAGAAPAAHEPHAGSLVAHQRRSYSVIRARWPVSSATHRAPRERQPVRLAVGCRERVLAHLPVERDASHASARPQGAPEVAIPRRRRMWA
jgi:hypothetical protein